MLNEDNEETIACTDVPLQALSVTVVFAAAHEICRRSLFFVFVLLKVKSVITHWYTNMYDFVVLFI